MSTIALNTEYHGAYEIHICNYFISVIHMTHETIILLYYFPRRDFLHNRNQCVCIYKN